MARERKAKSIDPVKSGAKKAQSEKFFKIPKESDLQAEAYEIGKKMGLHFSFIHPLPNDLYDPKIKRPSLSSFINKEEKFEVRGFSNKWRSLAPGQDELFATSIVRSLAKGLFDVKPYAKMNKNERQSAENLLWHLSDARILTKHTGFSTAKGRVQHPTGKNEGFFADAVTASLANAIDRARKAHVLRAMSSAFKLPKPRMDRAMGEGLKSAIAFTTNNFAAPVTAKGVKEFSTRKNRDIDDQGNIDQLDGRDRNKVKAQHYGGTLREKSPGESTKKKALEREWVPDTLFVENKSITSKNPDKLFMNKVPQNRDSSPLRIRAQKDPAMYMYEK